MITHFLTKYVVSIPDTQLQGLSQIVASLCEGNHYLQELNCSNCCDPLKETNISKNTFGKRLSKLAKMNVESLHTLNISGALLKQNINLPVKCTGRLKSHIHRFLRDMVDNTTLKRLDVSGIHFSS